MIFYFRNSFKIDSLLDILKRKEKKKSQDDLDENV